MQAPPTKRPLRPSQRRLADSATCLQGNVLSQLIASSRPGMGAIPFDDGVMFRVWAPHAERVSVTGPFCDWDAEAWPLAPEKGGTWSADVAGARAGDEYRFVVRAGGEERSRIDPRARQLTNSVGNAVVYDPAAFDWGTGEFATPAWNDLVIYELHVGTFSEGMHGRPGTLEGVPTAPGVPARAGHRRHPADAAVRVRRRPLVGLQPGLPVRGGVCLRPPRRSQGPRTRCPRGRHRGSPGRRLQPPGAVRPGPVAASTAGRRTTRAASTSTRTTVPPLRGVTHDPTTAATRCAPSSATTP